MNDAERLRIVEQELAELKRAVGHAPLSPRQPMRRTLTFNAENGRATGFIAEKMGPDVAPRVTIRLERASAPPSAKKPAEPRAPAGFRPATSDESHRLGDWSQVERVDAGPA